MLGHRLQVAGPRQHGPAGWPTGPRPHRCPHALAPPRSASSPGRSTAGVAETRKLGYHLGMPSLDHLWGAALPADLNWLVDWRTSGAVVRYERERRRAGPPGFIAESWAVSPTVWSRTTCRPSSRGRRSSFFSSAIDRSRVAADQVTRRDRQDLRPFPGRGGWVLHAEHGCGSARSSRQRQGLCRLGAVAETAAGLGIRRKRTRRATGPRPTARSSGSRSLPGWWAYAGYATAATPNVAAPWLVAAALQSPGDHTSAAARPSGRVLVNSLGGKHLDQELGRGVRAHS